MSGFDERPIGPSNTSLSETLAKAAVWYDRYQEEQATTLARAIEHVAVPKEQRSAALKQACMVAVEERAACLAQVARLLDQVIAMRKSQ